MMGLIAYFMNAQNAPTSTYEGPIVIDKPAPGGIGLVVEGGKTWLHNDDDGDYSSVLELGVRKNAKEANLKIYSWDGGTQNGMRIVAERAGAGFGWSRNSADGLQRISSFGGNDSYGQYLRLYGNSPDAASDLKVLLRTKGNSYLNTGGNFGLGTDAPTATLDVDGKIRFRDLPDISGGYVVTSDQNGNLTRQNYIDFINVLPQPIGDNLGNHEATKTLGMDGNWINGGKGGNAAVDGIFIKPANHNVGIGLATPLQKLHVKGNQIIDGDFLKIIDVNFLELRANVDNVNSSIDSDQFPLVINSVNNKNVGIGGLPDAKLDVHGKAKIRNLPLAELPFVTTDPTGVLHQSNYTPLDFTPDNLGNHCATQNLDMKGFDINFAKKINANEQVKIGTPSLTSTTTIKQNSIEINQIAPTDNSNILKLQTGEDKNDIDSKGKPLVLNNINNQNVGIGGIPNIGWGQDAPDAKLDVYGKFRVRDLPPGQYDIVTADECGTFYKISIDSLQGTRGETGPSGEDGRDGIDGATGPPGPAGADGAGDNLGNHCATDDLDMKGKRIRNLCPPELELDAATKGYVDDLLNAANKTTPDLISIISELKAEITTLKNRIETLENQ